MQYRKEIDVAGDSADVFAYLADFANTAEWDPGVVEARRLTPAPTAVGSRFEVIALFRGNRHRFEYVVADFVDWQRVSLHGEGARASSDDSIAVDAIPGGTRVTYVASIRLKGVGRIAEPLLGGLVTRMGDAALAGLQARLDA